MWPCFIINLHDNATRLANSAAQMRAHSIAWERIEAVNGWALSDEEIASVYCAKTNAARAKHPLVRPEIGCYLSHLAAWRRIAQGPAEGGFVFEDDFAAAPGLGHALDLLSAPQSEWDMVKLFSFDPSPKMVTRQRLGTDLEIGIPYRVPTCLIGYGLTRDAARRLAERAVPFFRPVDEDQKFFWETGLRVALVLPPPISVGDQMAEIGTIGDTRRAQAKRKRASLREVLHKIRYQIGYLGRLHYHRLLGHGK